MKIRLSELRQIVRESYVERLTQDIEKRLEIFRTAGRELPPGSPREYKMYKEILNLLIAMEEDQMTPDMRSWREERIKEVMRIHADANRTRSQRGLPPVA